MSKKENKSDKVMIFFAIIGILTTYTLINDQLEKVINLNLATVFLIFIVLLIIIIFLIDAFANKKK